MIEGHAQPGIDDAHPGHVRRCSRSMRRRIRFAHAAGYRDRAIWQGRSYFRNQKFRRLGVGSVAAANEDQDRLVIRQADFLPGLLTLVCGSRLNRADIHTIRHDDNLLGVHSIQLHKLIDYLPGSK